MVRNMVGVLVTQAAKSSPSYMTDTPAMKSSSSYMPSTPTVKGSPSSPPPAPLYGPMDVVEQHAGTPAPDEHGKASKLPGSLALEPLHGPTDNHYPPDGFPHRVSTPIKDEGNASQYIASGGATMSPPATIGRVDRMTRMIANDAMYMHGEPERNIHGSTSVEFGNAFEPGVASKQVHSAATLPAGNTIYPTPAKTPHKKIAVTAQEFGSTARLLFSSHSKIGNNDASTPQRGEQKHGRLDAFANAGFGGTSTRRQQGIAIYTDPVERVPQLDTDGDNPFYVKKASVDAPGFAARHNRSYAPGHHSLAIGQARLDVQGSAPFSTPARKHSSIAEDDQAPVISAGFNLRELVPGYTGHKGPKPATRQDNTAWNHNNAFGPGPIQRTGQTSAVSQEYGPAFLGNQYASVAPSQSGAASSNNGNHRYGHNHRVLEASVLGQGPVFNPSGLAYYPNPHFTNSTNVGALESASHRGGAISGLGIGSHHGNDSMAQRSAHGRATVWDGAIFGNEAGTVTPSRRIPDGPGFMACPRDNAGADCDDWLPFSTNQVPHDSRKSAVPHRHKDDDDDDGYADDEDEDPFYRSQARRDAKESATSQRDASIAGKQQATDNYGPRPDGMYFTFRGQKKFIKTEELEARETEGDSGDEFMGNLEDYASVTPPPPSRPFVPRLLFATEAQKHERQLQDTATLATTFATQQNDNCQLQVAVTPAATSTTQRSDSLQTTASLSANAEQARRSNAPSPDSRCLPAASAQKTSPAQPVATTRKFRAARKTAYGSNRRSPAPAQKNSPPAVPAPKGGIRKRGAARKTAPSNYNNNNGNDCRSPAAARAGAIPEKSVARMTAWAEYPVSARPARKHGVARMTAWGSNAQASPTAEPQAQGPAQAPAAAPAEPRRPQRYDLWSYLTKSGTRRSFRPARREEARPPSAQKPAGPGPAKGEERPADDGAVPSPHEMGAYAFWWTAASSSSSGSGADDDDDDDAVTTTATTAATTTITTTDTATVVTTAATTGSKPLAGNFGEMFRLRPVPPHNRRSTPFGGWRRLKRTRTGTSHEEEEEGEEEGEGGVGQGPGGPKKRRRMSF